MGSQDQVLLSSEATKKECTSMSEDWIDIREFLPDINYRVSMCNEEQCDKCKYSYLNLLGLACDAIDKFINRKDLHGHVGEDGRFKYHVSQVHYFFTCDMFKKYDYDEIQGDRTDLAKNLRELL